MVPENHFPRINFAIKESILLNLLFSLISLTKIAFETSLLIGNNENCEISLRIWMTAMLINDILNFCLFFLIILEILGSLNEIQNTLMRNSLDNSFRNFDLTFHSEIRRRFGNENSFNGFDVNNNIERNHLYTSYLLEFSRFCYMLIFLFGNVIFFSQNSYFKGFFEAFNFNLFNYITRKKPLVLDCCFGFFGYGIYVLYSTFGTFCADLLVFALWAFYYLLLS